MSYLMILRRAIRRVAVPAVLAVVAHVAPAAANTYTVSNTNDTLEESAYLVARSLPPEKPVVFTGAMRPASDSWSGTRRP